jgi:hypothetical protein
VAGGVAGLWTVDGGTSSPFSFAPAFGPSVIVVVLGVVMLRWRETPVSLDASAMAASPA